MTDSIDKYGSSLHLPQLTGLKIKGCLHLKPGTHDIDVARLKIARDASVCVRLRGDRDGFTITEGERIAIINGITISAPRNFIDFILGSKEHLRWNSITVQNGIPYLNESYTTSRGCIQSWNNRSINILKKYGASIPIRYDPQDNRRYTAEEVDEAMDDFSVGEWMLPHPRFLRLRNIPILGQAYDRGLLPRHISYRVALNLMRVLSSTNSWIEPETREEKIADGIFRALGASIASTSTQFEFILDRYERPGLIAVFGGQNLIRGTLHTSKGFEAPYDLSFKADVDLKRLALGGLIDLRNVHARVSSRVHLPADKLATLNLSITNINAPVSHNNMTGTITDGVQTTPRMPSGIQLMVNASRHLVSTANLHVTYRIPTPRGAFIVEGDVLARLKGRWNGLTAQPRITYGRNKVVVDNVNIFSEGSSKPLIANARLIISDRARDKQRIKNAHTDIPMINAGFAIQLTAPLSNGSGFKQASAATYIHVPLNRRNTHYDLKHFSLQKVLEVAFRFATEDRHTVQGHLSITRQHKGWNLVARAKADELTLRQTRLIKPSLVARLYAKDINNIDIQQVRVAARHVRHKGTTIERVKLIFSKGALMAGAHEAYVRLDSFFATAANIHTRGATIARGAFASTAPLDLYLSRDRTHLKRLSASFSLIHMRPSNLRRIFDFKGHINSEWNGTHGRLSVRLDQKSFTGAHLIVTRINRSKDGDLTAAFCLRKPTNLAKLKSLGIHSKGTIWFVTGSNSMPLTSRAILKQLGIYRGGRHGQSSTTSARVRQRCERLFGVRR